MHNFSQDTAAPQILNTEPSELGTIPTPTIPFEHLSLSSCVSTTTTTTPVPQPQPTPLSKCAANSGKNAENFGQQIHFCNFAKVRLSKHLQRWEGFLNKLRYERRSNYSNCLQMPLLYWQINKWQSKKTFVMRCDTWMLRRSHCGVVWPDFKKV